MGKFLSTGKGVVITVALALLVAFWAGLLLVTNRAASRTPQASRSSSTHSSWPALSSIGLWKVGRFPEVASVG